MISLIYKLANYTWSKFISNDEQLPLKKLPHAPDSNVVCANKSEQECSIQGVVTKINNLESYGIINQYIYFSFDVVYGNEKVAVGSNVSVRAVRQSALHGWKAVSVQIWGKDWGSGGSEGCVGQTPRLTKETTDWDDEESSKKMECQVTDWFGSFGILDHKYHFELGGSEQNFHPLVGDVVTACVQRAKVISWSPKCILGVEGVVTAHEIDFGVVNEDVVFFFASCRCSAPVACGEEVIVDVVHSDQQMYKLRAFSLSLAGRQAKNVQVKPCFPDHAAVYITNHLDFGLVESSGEKVLPVTVRNTEADPLSFIGCHFEGKCDKQLFSILRDDDVSCIPPHSEVNLKVLCSPQYLGRHEALLVFEFGQFLISRKVTAFVMNPLQLTLAPAAPSLQKKPKPVKGNLLDDLVVIPGRKLHLPKANFLGHKPQYTIPRSLWKVVEQRHEISESLPVLEENVDVNNYICKFSCLLHLEEIQMIIHMQNFDMFEVVLQKRGEFLGLEVPGLAEGRPSLLIGDRAMLLPPNARTFVYEGYIHEVHKDDILLKFNENFHQRYGGETYDVTFRFSRTNIKRMHESLHTVSQNIIALLFPKRVYLQKPLVKVFSEASRSCQDICRAIHWQNKFLNKPQKQAILRILEGRSRPLPYVIFGPPGTGKTVTLVEAILQVHSVFRNSRILVCTPSNSAADLIAERLIETEHIDISDMVRLNSYQRSVDTIPEFIKPFCKDKEVMEEAVQIPIVVSTCSTAGALLRLDLAADHFTHLFIDEAGQLTEPESLVPISLVVRNRNASIVLAGDPLQLGPVLLSNVAKKYGLEISYLERIMQNPLYSPRKEQGHLKGFNPYLLTMLTESYRSHPAILHYSAQKFYFSNVNCSTQNEHDDILMNCKLLPKVNFPIVFHGVRGDESREENSPSWFNSTEVVQCCQYLRSLYELGLTPSEVGIIAPYRKQVEKIGLLSTAFGLDLCKVGSVEEFQGQERRAVIITTVRSSENFIRGDILHNLGFLSSPKRFNVAVTRARDLLIVIGNPFVLSTDLIWRGFIKYCHFNGAYIGCDISSLNLEGSC